MTYSVQSSRADPTLEYDVTDAATGAPMRLTVLGGVAGLVTEQKGMRVMRPGKPEDPERVGFYVPGMQPLPAGPDPVVIPEVFLAQVGVYLTDLHATRLHGVGGVQAQIVADPQNAGQRWVYLSFDCIGNEPMVVRYRVTIYRPTP